MHHASCIMIIIIIIIIIIIMMFHDVSSCATLARGAGGSLFELLRNAQVPLDWLQRARIAREVACGMDFVHQQEVVLKEITSHHVVLSRPPGRLMVAKLDINYPGALYV